MTKKSIRDSFKEGFDKIKEIAGSFISRNDAEKQNGTTNQDGPPINFTEIFELSRSSNLRSVLTLIFQKLFEKDSS